MFQRHFMLSLWGSPSSSPLSFAYLYKYIVYNERILILSYIYPPRKLEHTEGKKKLKRKHCFGENLSINSEVPSTVNPYNKLFQWSNSWCLVLTIIFKSRLSFDSNCLAPCSTQCDPWINTNSFTEVFGKNVEFQAPPESTAPPSAF